MNRPKRAVVEPPDSRGLREVRVDGVTVGRAWSPRELRRLLVRAGFPKDVDLADGTSVSWRGENGTSVSRRGGDGASVSRRGGDGESWPDRPLRRRAVTALLVAGLLGSTALLIHVGLVDMVGAFTFAGRVSGFLFVLAGILTGGAAAAALDLGGKRRFRYAGAFVLVGVIITAATCTLLLVLWLQEKEFTPYLLTYLPLWVWSLWALWLVCRERPWRGIPHPKKFAAGVTASAFLAAANLAYSAAYQPSAAQIHFVYRLKFGTPYADPERPVIHLPLTISMENTGTVPFWVLGSAFVVYGRSSAFTADEKVIKDWRQDAQDSELYVGTPAYTVIRYGTFVPAGALVSPGSHALQEKVLQVPKEAGFDAVEASSAMTVLRRDRGIVDLDFNVPHYSWFKGESGRVDCPACGDFALHFGRLRYNNNIMNVTRKPRYVTSLRYLDSASRQRYGVVVSPLDAAGKVTWNPDPEDRLDLLELGSGLAAVSFASVLKQLR
ncbi:hypothetical protein [Streptomyces sp. NPDC051211]|uniref:hypothetical protein n=1 Tax=Streptomyces sp. NPDC051211 TaxID=3154643 RepID=UPI00344D356F